MAEPFEAALGIISSTLSRIESKLDSKADKSDLSRIEGRLDEHGDRIAKVEKAQRDDDIELQTLERQKAKKGRFIDRLIMSGFGFLSTVAIILELLHPFGI